MTHPDTETSAHAVSTAAQRFIWALSEGAQLDQVDRIETELVSDDAALALSFDRLFADAWPSATAPRHEVTWGAERRVDRSLAMAAFDHRGRPLLRERYCIDATEPTAQPVDDPAPAPGSTEAAPTRRAIFLVEARPVADALVRVLGPFAVLSAELVTVDAAMAAGRVRIRIEAAGLDDQAAETLRKRVANLTVAESVAFGWTMLEPAHLQIRMLG